METSYRAIRRDAPCVSLFSGPEPGLREYLVGLGPSYYVYALCLPDGAPFYVGKGVRDRVFHHVLEARRNHRVGETNPHKCNKIRQLEAAGLGVTYAILSIHETSPDAEREEGRLIALLGRAAEGGPLTNLAPGRESGLQVHPETRSRHSATLGLDPGNPARDPETRRLNEFMSTIVVVKSTPLKPRSRYHGSRVRHTTGTTRSSTPKPRSAGALAISASLNGGSLRHGAIVPRCFTYAGIPGILENGASNDIIGTGLAEIVPSRDPAEESFVISHYGADAIRCMLGDGLLRALALID